MCWANSHVAWLQGTGFQDYNEYDHVEVWASPYSPDPSQLAPFKLGNEPERPSIQGYIMGGHGLMAYGIIRTGMEYRVTVIWDLESKTRLERVLPSNIWSRQPLGVTRNHYWMIGTEANSGNDGDYLIRLQARP